MKDQNRINSITDGYYNFPPSTPAENLNPNPKALLDALEILAPTAAQDHTLLAKLYAFSNASPGQFAAKLQDVNEYLQCSLKPQERKNIDIILTILDGVAELMEHLKLQSPEDLDAYLQAHEEMFAYRLLKNDGNARAGRAGKTL